MKRLVLIFAVVISVSCPAPDFYQPQRVLVTGANGFVGSAVMRYLARLQISAIGLVRENSNLDNLQGVEGTLVRGDITDFASLLRAMEGVDAVVHTAAHVTDWDKRENFESINVIGTRNVLEAARQLGVRRLVHVSTVDVFGLQKGPVTDETPLTPSGYPYPDTKIKAEREVWSYYARFSLPVSIIRPTMVYGPGDRTFVPEIAAALLKHQPVLLGPSSLTVDLVYIDNLAEGIVLALRHPSAIGRGFIINDGSMLFHDYIRSIADVIGVKPFPLRIPVLCAKAYAAFQEGYYGLRGRRNRPELTRYAVDFITRGVPHRADAARDVLGYKPQVSIQRGIRLTQEWLSHQNPETLKKK